MQDGSTKGILSGFKVFVGIILEIPFSGSPEFLPCQECEPAQPTGSAA